MPTTDAPQGATQIDAGQVLTLRLTGADVFYLSQLLSAQTLGAVTQAGRQHLLAEMAKQIAAQAHAGSAQALQPPGEAVPIDTTDTTGAQAEGGRRGE